MLFVWENCKTDRQTDRQLKSATFDAKNYISLIISTDEIPFRGVVFSVLFYL